MRQPGLTTPPNGSTGIGAEMARSLLLALLIAALAVIAIGALTLLPDGRLIAQQMVSGLMLGAIFATVAVAFTLTVGVLNFLNFTIPTLFMLTGMVAWGLSRYGLPFGSVVGTSGGLHWLVALVSGIMVAVVASLIVERFTFRYLKARHGDATEHAIPLVSSLGFLLIFEYLVLIALGSEQQRFVTPFRADLHIAGLVIGLPQVASLVLSLAIVAGLTAILKGTHIGRALRAIAESPDTALLLGLDVVRIVQAVFLLTGLLCGIAGALFTVNYGDVSPYMGDQVGTKAIAAMVLGGLGSIWGAIIGGLLLGLIETLSLHVFGGEAVQMVVWGLLLVVIIVRPQGLFGGSRLGKGRV